MTVYVDQPHHYDRILDTQARRLGPDWCHLFADSDDELHEFAKMMSLKREWFQEHKSANHYDLTPNRRAKAIEFGATQITTKNFFRMKGRREQGS